MKDWKKLVGELTWNKSSVSPLFYNIYWLILSQTDLKDISKLREFVGDGFSSTEKPSDIDSQFNSLKIFHNPR